MHNYNITKYRLIIQYIIFSTQLNRYKKCTMIDIMLLKIRKCQ